jgi:hypothetical protein
MQAQTEREPALGESQQTHTHTHTARRLKENAHTLSVYCYCYYCTMSSHLLGEQQQQQQLNSEASSSFVRRSSRCRSMKREYTVGDPVEIHHVSVYYSRRRQNTCALHIFVLLIHLDSLTVLVFVGSHCSRGEPIPTPRGAQYF